MYLFFHEVMIMLTTLIATVTRKRIETTNATFRSLFLSMKIFILLRGDDSISEAIRSIVAVMASQRLMSQKDKGNCILVTNLVCV